jgi:ABC-type lipoprotein release transport system permease subunit
MKLTKNIIRALLQNRKYTFLLFAIVLLSVVAITTVMNIIKTNETIMLNDTYDTYGSYTVLIEDYTVIPRLKDMESDKRIVYARPIYEETVYENECSMIYYKTTENALGDIGCKIIDGTFPKASNEVMAERSYLYSLGLISADMVGARISLPDQDGEHYTDYKISGVMQFDSAGASNDDEIRFVFFNEQHQYNCVLLQINDLENYDRVLDEITNEYNINPNKCFINFNLFTVLGIMTGENVLTANTRFFMIIYLIIILCSMVAFYNILKLSIEESRIDFSIINMLGVKKGLIILAYVTYILVIVLCGIIVGLLISYSIALPLSCLFLMEKISYPVIIRSVRGNLLLGSISSYLLIIGIVLLPIAYRLYNLSAVEIFNNQRFVSKSRKGKPLFSIEKKKKNIIIELAKNCMRNSKINLATNTVAVGLVISLLVIGMYFIKVNIQAFGYSCPYDFKIEFDMDYDESEQECFYMEALNNHYMVVKPDYSSVLTAKFDSNVLNNDYVSYLGKRNSTDIGMTLGYSQYVKLGVVVLGYDDSQINALMNSNGKDNLVLNPNQAIVLSNTIPLRGDEGFPLSFGVGDIIEFESGGRYPVEVVSVVDKLKEYPSGLCNMVCVVVKEETFKTLTGKTYPDVFYVNSVKGYERETEVFLSGNDGSTLTIPEEQEQYLIKSNQILRRVVILFSALIFVTAAVSIYCSIYTKIHINIRDLITLRCIGISKDKLSLANSLEILLIYICGCGLSFLISYIITRSIQSLMLGDLGNYLYSFPVGIFISACLLVVLILPLCIIPIVLRINRIDTLLYIKSENQ